MLKKARLMHYNPEKGFGFLKCLGYSGDCETGPEIFFHVTSLATPSINETDKMVRFTYASGRAQHAALAERLLPWRDGRYAPSPDPVYLAYKPHRHNQKRAYTVCAPEVYLQEYAGLHARYTPSPNGLRFFLDSWFCADLSAHAKVGVEASIQYIHTRLCALRTTALAPECAALLSQAITLFQATLCALYRQDEYAVTRLELLRFGLLRYDNLLEPIEGEEVIARLLSELPPAQQSSWAQLAQVFTPQPSFS